MNIKSKFQYAQQFFRKTHLLNFVEYIDYLFSVVGSFKRNSSFVKRHPDFTLPPRHLAYDAYSAPDWEFYKESGEESAVYLRDVMLQYSGSGPADSVLEWGCGPGRIIRHLPEFCGETTAYFGTDYNGETIKWCSSNISGINFSVNNLNPPLSFASGNFDFIYAISVFTHLSEPVGLKWIEELHRLLKPNGVLLITLKGDNYHDRLLPDEKVTYDSAGIVVRGNVTEGKKMFATFHNPKYVREKLLSKFQILNHITEHSPLSEQDTWIAKKTGL
ncbi:MAG: hypothetical protein A2075_06115 [Geobacteraceae bacterium GWC2_58_44]|nr:MAG: hypothetical protein A2075_06115 [Geobacteraceae bacterium GWC2_58_44]HBG05738.1 hypothetical protein [Geobacter sp.]